MWLPDYRALHSGRLIFSDTFHSFPFSTNTAVIDDKHVSSNLYLLPLLFLFADASSSSHT